MSRATFPGAPGYGGVRTWVEGSQIHALLDTDLYRKLTGVGRDNINDFNSCEWQLWSTIIEFSYEDKELLKRALLVNFLEIDYFG